jgi:hypothetical protein
MFRTLISSLYSYIYDLSSILLAGSSTQFRSRPSRITKLVFVVLDWCLVGSLDIRCSSVRLSGSKVNDKSVQSLTTILH